jgi:glycosyltransferase involved in cell wall biosynthesis
VEPLVNRSARIIDRRPREEMPDYLALADVLVSPALRRQRALKIFDYLAAGRPIVATDIPTHRTLLAEDRAVLVAPEPQALARESRYWATRPGAPPRRGRRTYSDNHLGWNGRRLDRKPLR